MIEIAPPAQPDDYPEIIADREIAIEPAFQDLVSRAESAGWSEDDVALALLSLAAQHVKGIMTDRRTLAAMTIALSAKST